MTLAVRAGRPQAFGRAGKAIAPVRLQDPAIARAAADVAPGAVAAPPWRFHFGFLTHGGWAVLVAIFIYEMRISGSTGSLVSPYYRIAIGGESWKYIAGQHEWWRFFTAAWLHSSVGHLAGNGLALVITGWMLERVLGRGWLLAGYVTGAIGGSIGSLAFMPAASMSVGASGAIMALVALLFTVSFHASIRERTANRYRVYALLTLVPALMPSVTDSGAFVDIGAHFGGAVAGTAFGFLLLAIWPEESGDKPPFGWAAVAVGVAGLAVTGFAFWANWQHMPPYLAEARLLAPLPVVETADKENRTQDLVAAYPHDPSVRLVRALHLYSVHDMTGALGEIRAGLAEKRLLATYYTPEKVFDLRLLLVLGLMAEERLDDARNEAQPICPVVRDRSRWPTQNDPGGKLAEIIALVRDNHICD